MAAKAPIERFGEIMKTVLTELENAGGEATLEDLFERSEPKLNLSESEKRVLGETGYVWWKSIVHYYSFACVSAGYLQKSEDRWSGNLWKLTIEGEKALELPPAEFIRATRAHEEELPLVQEPTSTSRRAAGLLALFRLLLWALCAPLILAIYNRQAAILHFPLFRWKRIPDWSSLRSALLVPIASALLVWRKYLFRIAHYEPTFLTVGERVMNRVSYVFWVLLPVGVFYLPTIVASLPELLVRLCGLVVILCLGYSAYVFKRNNQLAYGVIEVVFGLVSGVRVLQGLDVRNIVLTQWAVLIGCCYIVARGFNNVSDAKDALGISSLKDEVHFRLRKT